MILQAQFDCNYFRLKKDHIFIIHLSQVQLQRQSTPEDAELGLILGHLKDKFQNTMKILQAFQSKNSENIFNTGLSVISYLFFMFFIFSE